jgi:hypothetical protein
MPCTGRCVVAEYFVDVALLGLLPFVAVLRLVGVFAAHVRRSVV